MIFKKIGNMENVEVICHYLLLFSLAARSIGLLCAREGRKLESCRAHLTFFSSVFVIITGLLCRYGFKLNHIFYIF